jgi:hypothetical protein
MAMSIELRQVPALQAACIAIHTRLDRTGPDCGPVFGRLATALKPLESRLPDRGSSGTQRRISTRRRSVPWSPFPLHARCLRRREWR